MKIAPLPDDEEARLAVLRGHHILDTPPEEFFNDLTTLAADICGTPIALVSLVDEHRQWFKSKVGIDTTETSRDIAFCAHAIHGEDLFVVPDTTDDERFADNPLVTADPNIRFYAGMPLMSADGHAMGTLCVLDRIPRHLTNAQQNALKRLGRQVAKLITLRHHQHQAEQAMFAHRQATQAQTALLSALAYGLEGMALLNADGRYTYMNHAHAEIYGYQSEELLGQSWKSLYQAEWIETIEQECFPILLSTGRWHGEVIGRTKSGGEVMAEISLVLLPNTSNPDQSLLCTCRDITDRKQATEALQTNEARLRCALDVATDGLWDWTFPTLQAYYSPSWLRLLGLEDQEIPLNNVFDWKHRIHQDDRPWVEQALADHLQGRTASYVVEHRVRHRSGEWKWFSMRGKVVQRDGQERPVRMMGTMTDITERKQADIERLERESTLTKFKTTLDQTLDSVFMFHPDTMRFTYCNRGARGHLGYSQTELFGMTPVDLTPDFTHEQFQAMVEPLRTGTQQSLSFETLHRHKNGHDIPVEIFLQLVKLEKQEQIFVAVVRDTTERKRIEAAVKSSEERLNAAVSVGHIGIFEHYHQNDRLYWSPILREIFGIRPDEPASLQRYLSLVHEADRERVLAAVRQAHDPTGNGEFHIEHRIVRPNGDIRYLSLYSHTYFAVGDTARVPARTIGTVMDISAGKQTEAMVREQETRLRAIVNHAVDGIITIDEIGNIESFNPAAERIFGYTADEVMGRNVKILMPEPYRSEHDGYLTHYRDTGQAKIIGIGREVAGRRKDGSSFPLDLAVSKMEVGDRRHFTGIVRDITDRKRVETALQESEEHHRLLVDQVTDYAIIRLDTEGHIASWNNGAARITGYQDAEILGESMARFHSPDDVAQDKPRQLLLAALAQGRMEDEGWRLRKDGSHYWANVIITPLYNHEGALRGFSNVTRDITDQKATTHRLEQATLEMECRAIELEEAHEQALAATKAKSEFLASMSHEIRTPLNAIVAMADLLQETVLSKEQREYVGWFSRASTGLLDLINNILDISKIEAGHLELESIVFDLHDLIQTTAELMTARAQAKQLELSVFIDPAITPWRTGDPTRLRQVFMNLMGNAIKFTEHGDVVIRVEPDGTDPTTIRCAVSDTGLGIPNDKIGMIFENFTQVDSSTTRKYGGTGLGLGICKRLVELMGGEIGVTSTPGVGSTFSFSIGLPEGPAPATASSSTALDLQLHNHRLLVVDDNAASRTIIRQYLQPFGATLVEASDGSTALHALANAAQQGQPITLAIVDSHMPNMDGLSLVRAIRKREHSRPLPVIMLASHLRNADHEETRDLEITDYLYKPISRRRLLESLAAALCQAPTLFTITQTAAEAQTILEPLRILLAEDLEDNRAVVRLFLKDTPHIIEEAENGAIALQKFQEGSYDLVLMDMQMPVMDGLMATAAMRAWEQDHQQAPTPIIALTANVLKEDLNKSLAAGCVAHVTKPVRKKTLLAAIAQYATPPSDLAA